MHCVGCHKDEPSIVDHKTKTIWLCRKFVEGLYGSPEDWDTNKKKEEK